MSGLVSGQELEVVRISSKATANIKANVAVQLPTGKRIQNHYPANLTLWELLLQVETASGTPLTKVEDPKTGKYMIPSLMIMNKEFATLQLLKGSTLYGVGASKAPILFRLRFKPSTLTLAQVLEQEQEAIKAKEAAAAAAAAEAEAKEKATMEKAKEEPPKAKEAKCEEKKEEDEKPSMIAEKKKKNEEEVKKEEEKPKAMEAEKEPAKKEDVGTKDSEVSEAEKERIIQEYLKKYQLTDKDLQRFNEEQAKLQLQQQLQQAKAPAQAPREEPKKAAKEEPKPAAPADPYGKATDEDVPEEEREVKVFSPSTSTYNPADYDLPDSFYDLTAEDLRALRKNAAQEAEEERTLMTREMREKRARAKCKVFTRCQIRVRFPDMIELQRVFLPNAKVGAIFRIVRESLADPTTEFSLYTTPPKRMLDNQEVTLAKRGLVPATIVYIKFADPNVVNTKYLREDLEAKIVARNEVPRQPQQEQQHPQMGKKSGGGHSLMDNHYCGMCMTSIGLDKCLECENYYCRKCWNEVHKDGAMAEHHRAGMKSGPVAGSGSAPGKKKHDMSEEEKKQFVPKWFKLGKQ